MLRSLTAFLLLAAVLAPDAPLEWKWKENDQFWVQYASEYHDKNTFAGAEQKQQATVKGVFQITVQKANADRSAVLGVKVHKFDFSNVQAKPLADKLSGADFEVSVDPGLTITKIDGLEKVIKALPGADEMDKGQFKFMVRIVEGMNRYWLTELLIAMPNKETKAGDQWEQKTTLNLDPLGLLIMQRRLKDAGPVQEDGKELRKITMDVTFDCSPSKNEDNVLPFKIEKMEMKRSECSTVAVFDPAAGRLMKSASKQSYAMHLKMDIAGTSREGDNEREQTHDIRVLDRNPLK
jgi:hypothetical protein